MQATIDNHTVEYDDTTSSALRYLTIIGYEESKVFFDEALNHGYAKFEDHSGCKYKLVRKDSTYQLTKA